MTMADPNNSQLTNGVGAQLDVKIGFIGAGQMAQALCKGFISSGLLIENAGSMSDNIWV